MEAWSVAAQKLIDQSRSERIAFSPQQRKEMRKQARQQAVNDVFGVGHKTDKAGTPIEQGIGAPGNGSLHDAEAYKKAYLNTPDWDEEVYKAKVKNAHETSARRAKQRQEEDEDE